ncbi:MAG: hypothetical protein ACK463_02495 [Bradyrhizobium sp.]|uniref:hypothetical protein n=1 Tax=Bradyrhizobium TaxID=374 RepID=UPI0015551B29|nr:hypothetical protein [Bradyrhizobium sp. LMG 8443]NPU25269.1 hypothetical protein [Bradyrhizobium sp. LMG 8443]
MKLLRGQPVRWLWRRGLHEVVAAINYELTEMTVAYGSKLRREAKLTLPQEPIAEYAP